MRSNARRHRVWIFTDAVCVVVGAGVVGVVVAFGAGVPSVGAGVVGVVEGVVDGVGVINSVVA